MTDLKILIDGDREAFRPGETIRGSVEWKHERAPKSVEARLYWRVEGSGDGHVETLMTVAFENAGPQERRPFQFAFPRGPYSFEGRLLSLTWGVEVVILPGKHAARVEFVVAPDGEPVHLHPEPTANPEERSTPQ